MSRLFRAGQYNTLAGECYDRSAHRDGTKRAGGSASGTTTGTAICWRVCRWQPLAVIGSSSMNPLSRPPTLLMWHCSRGLAVAMPCTGRIRHRTAVRPGVFPLLIWPAGAAYLALLRALLRCWRAEGQSAGSQQARRQSGSHRVSPEAI